MCFIDYESPSFFHAEIRIARKQHRCTECCNSAAIQPGDEYHYVTGIWEGRFGCFKTCRACSYWRWRIHQVEERNGCLGGEAIPPYGGLTDLVDQYEFRDFGRLIPAGFSLRKQVLDVI